jgi:hypothetical protein
VFGGISQNGINWINTVGIASGIDLSELTLSLKVGKFAMVLSGVFLQSYIGCADVVGL